MPYYNGAWLSDDEYEQVTRAAQARASMGDNGGNGLTPRMQQSNEWDTGVGAPNTYINYNNTPAGADARDRGGALPAGYTWQPQGNYTAPTTRPVATPVDRGAAIVSPANSGGGVARPDNQRAGESYEQYLTRFYAAYGQRPPTVAGPAAAPRPSGGGGGGAPRPAQAPSYMPSVAAPAGWNESAYLRANPDVARAVAQNRAQGIPYSGYDHYVRDGQRENRPTSPMLGSMTEAEYLARNPDVARAVASGAFASGQDHWLRAGRNEVRPGGREFNDFEKANPWSIGVPVPAGGWKQPQPTAPAQPHLTRPRWHWRRTRACMAQIGGGRSW